MDVLLLPLKIRVSVGNYACNHCGALLSVNEDDLHVDKSIKDHDHYGIFFYCGHCHQKVMIREGVPAGVLDRLFGH